MISESSRDLHRAFIIMAVLILGFYILLFTLHKSTLDKSPPASRIDSKWIQKHSDTSYYGESGWGVDYYQDSVGIGPVIYRKEFIDSVDYSFNSYKLQLVLTDSCVFLGDSAPKNGIGAWRVMTPSVITSGRWKVFIIEVPEKERFPYEWMIGMPGKDDRLFLRRFLKDTVYFQHRY